MSDALYLRLRSANCLPLAPLLFLTRTAVWEVLVGSLVVIPERAFNSGDVAVKLKVPRANAFEGLLKTSTRQIEKPKMREKAEAIPS